MDGGCSGELGRLAQTAVGEAGQIAGPDEIYIEAP